MEIKKMVWDSDYFGINVVEIDLTDTDYTPSLVASKLDQNKVDLAFCRSTKLFSDFNNDKYHFQYILKRLPLIKEMKQNNPFHPNISVYNEKNVDHNLIKLAQLTGRMGRFGQDPYVSSEQCNDIFRNLIINSVNKTIASDVLVYRDRGEIVGFCTIRLMGDKAYIPIIGVFPEYEGLGVGFSLMSAVETYLYRSECKFAIGGTQDFNERAKKAFVRFGLKLGEPEYVYHIWNKNKI